MRKTGIRLVSGIMSIVLVAILLSGCVYSGKSEVTVVLERPLKENEQVYIRYIDGSTLASGSRTDTVFTMETDDEKSIVGGYISDGFTSWVPTLSPSNDTGEILTVTVSNMDGSKPDAPAIYASLAEIPFFDNSNDLSVTLSVYGDIDQFLTKGNTEVFAITKSDIIYDHNNTFATYSGISSSTTEGKITFRFKVPDKDNYAFPVKFYSGETLLLDTYFYSSDVELDKEALEIGYSLGDTSSSVTNSVYLPANGQSGSEIAWSSSRPEILSSTGAVNRPAAGSGDAVVELTAAITKNGESSEKLFALTVKQQDAAPSPSSEPNPSPSPSPISMVKIEGSTGIKAAIQHDKNESGQAVTIINVQDNTLVNSYAAEQKNLINLNIIGADPIVKVELPANDLLKLVSTNADTVIRIQVEGASYAFPVGLLSGLAENTTVTLVISQLTEVDSDTINRSIEQQGSTPMITHPVDFTITYQGQEVTDWAGTYVERSLTLQQSIDPNTTTAVWVDASNKMHFVPSVFSMEGGISEVTIRSPHNSVYTVVHSLKAFTDLQGHWAKADVELLANKLIVEGVSSSLFHPNDLITRAEFSALLVRVLGLAEQKQAATFTDVAAEAWYANAVQTAWKAGLVSGYEDGSFKPDRSITREQIVAIIERAMNYADVKVQINPSALSKFTDEASISTWARDAAAITVETNIITGKSSNTFAAQENATRAEAAAILKRLLQFIKFIN